MSLAPDSLCGRGEWSGRCVVVVIASLVNLLSYASFVLPMCFPASCSHMLFVLLLSHLAGCTWTSNFTLS